MTGALNQQLGDDAGDDATDRCRNKTHTYKQNRFHVCRHQPVTQLVEHCISNPMVIGSIHTQ